MLSDPQVSLSSSITCGIDLVDYEAFQRATTDNEERFFSDYFTKAERRLCDDRIKCLAGRFAVKEAVVKALGTGISDGITLKSIETLRSVSGQPTITLRDEAKNKALERNLRHWSVSISHGDNCVVAMVIAHP